MARPGRNGHARDGGLTGELLQMLVALDGLNHPRSVDLRSVDFKPAVFSSVAVRDVVARRGGAAPATDCYIALAAWRATRPM